MNIEKALTGSILGTAAGDSMGLTWEGIPPGRQARMAPEPLRQCFFLGHGMISDDTEHTCMVARSLAASQGERACYMRLMSHHLRLWFICLPAGIGMATLKAIIKLLAGFPPEKSGVFSAGNGPSMRSALPGILYGGTPDKMKEIVRATTIITHRDPKAEYGALAVAVAASMATRQEKETTPDAYCSELRKHLPQEAGEFLRLIDDVAASLARGEDTEQYAASRGFRRGISGYTYHTVPAVIHCWLRHQSDFRGGITEIISCGGDTDTTAAILGALIGAHTGEEGIPEAWLSRLRDWPCSAAYMRRLASALAQSASGEKADLPAFYWPALFLRNIFFTVIVLLHGFRRLLPPY